MKYFLDTEFIEDGKTIDLISIGMVAEDRRELYLENADCDHGQASPWVQENVLPHLNAYKERLGQPPQENIVPKDRIAQEVIGFCNPYYYGKPEFWGYYADYDWVVFCQLFGTMMDLPKTWPMYCMDLKQFCVMLGDPKLPKQSTGEHHALADAKWNREIFELLKLRSHDMKSLEI